MVSPSDITAMDNLIKAVDEAPRRSRAGEHYIAVKSTTGEIVSPWSWNLVGGKRYIYRIYSEDSGQPRADGRSNTIYVRDPETGDSVNLIVSYQASCPKGKVETLARALGQNGSPDDELRRRIAAIADTFLFGYEREFFSNFEKLKSELAQRISDTVIQETGLNFRAQVQLAREQDLSPYHIKQQVEVRFRDSQQPQTLIFECDLDVVPQFTLRAIVTYDRLRYLHSSLINSVIEYFRLQVPAEAHASEFTGSDITEGLRIPLNELAAKHGRQVNGLTLRAQRTAGYIPPNFVERILHAQVQPLGRVEPITLTSRIQLMRDDLARFQKATVTNLDDWLENTFDNVIRVVCFEKKYLEYLQVPSWTVIEKEIKAELIARAKSIGYSVKQIFSLPELRENDFKELKYHRFDLIGLALRSTARAQVDLTVAATFFISDWNDPRIAEKINQGVDLNADITLALRQSLAAVLAAITPNDFILKFSEVDEAGNSIEARLQREAEAKLRNNYKAQVSSVIVTPVENDEIRRVREMLHVPRVLAFKATPYLGHETINFSVTWRVIDIEPNSWDKICRPTCNLDAIEKSLQDSLVAAFNAIDPQKLYMPLSEDVRALSEEGFRQPMQEIRSQYGLGVEPSNLTRGATAGEGEVRELLEWRRKAQGELFKQQVDKEVRIGQIQSSGEIRDAERAHEWQEERFKRLTDLRSQGRLTQEDRDELSSLEKEFNTRANQVGTRQPPKLPSLPDLNLDNEATAYKQLRRTTTSDQSAGEDRTASDNKPTVVIDNSADAGPPDGSKSTSP